MITLMCSRDYDNCTYALVNTSHVFKHFESSIANLHETEKCNPIPRLCILVYLYTRIGFPSFPFSCFNMFLNGMSVNPISNNPLD
jgi:hypothetical protein